MEFSLVSISLANKYRSNLRFCKNNCRLQVSYDEKDYKYSENSSVPYSSLQSYPKVRVYIIDNFARKLQKQLAPWKRPVIPPTEQPLTRFLKRNRERRQNNLCRRKLNSLTRTSLSQPPINQSSPQPILRFRSLITFHRLPRRSFMLIPWTHWISNIGPAILVPRANLNKRFPLTTHPRVLLRAISPFSSRIHTPFRRVSHPFLRSLGRCWTIEGVGWPRLLD